MRWHIQNTALETPPFSLMQLLEPAVFPRCSLELHGAKVSFLDGCPGQAYEACQYQLSPYLFLPGAHWRVFCTFESTPGMGNGMGPCLRSSAPHVCFRRGNGTSPNRIPSCLEPAKPTGPLQQRSCFDTSVFFLRRHMCLNHTHS